MVSKYATLLITLKTVKETYWKEVVADVLWVAGCVLWSRCVQIAWSKQLFTSKAPKVPDFDDSALKKKYP